MTEAVTGVAGITEQARVQASSTASGMSEDYEMFLRILVTQMQNQDPLSPMDATEYVSQLATFSQVEQLTNANAKLDEMSSVLVGGMARLDLGYIGMDVEAKVSEFKADGKPIDFRYVTDGADSVEIVITDREGNVVRTVTGESGAGEQRFTWDSKDDSGSLVDEGSYRIEIKALDKDGKQVSSVISMTGLVSEVITENGLSVLVFENGTTVDSANVVAIKKPLAAVPEGQSV